METIPEEEKNIAMKALGTAYAGATKLPGNFLSRKLASRRALQLRIKIYHSPEGQNFEVNDREAELIKTAASLLLEGRRAHGVEGDEEEVALLALIDRIKTKDS